MASNRAVTFMGPHKMEIHDQGYSGHLERNAPPLSSLSSLAKTGAGATCTRRWLSRPG
jgi:hypothetical protein